MAEKTTIARPYANAIFQVAEASNSLGRWSEMLRLAGMIIADSQIRPLVKNPRISADNLVSLILSVAGGEFDDSIKRVIKLLAQNKRLDVLPEICVLFDELKASAEKSVVAKVVSASELDSTARNTVQAALSAKLGKAVTLECEVDQSLIGGAIIRAGDLVIDGSVRGQITRLASALSH